MARRPRLDLAGFHHIVNRGVARGNIYESDKDKEKFLVYSSRDSKASKGIFCNGFQGFQGSEVVSCHLTLNFYGNLQVAL